MLRLLVLAMLLSGCAGHMPGTFVLPTAWKDNAQHAHDQGKRLREEGRYDQAVSPLEHALAMKEAGFGVNHPEVANTLLLLGDIHRLRGDLDRAEPLLLRAKDIQEAAHGKSSIYVAGPLTSLAILYRSLGDLSKAEPLLQRALEVRRTHYGPDHLHVAASRSNLAKLYISYGDYARAEPLLLDALKVQKAMLGPSHYQLTSTLNSLGILYSEQDKYEKATAYYEESLAISTSHLDPNHPELATSLDNLAVVYYSRGYYAKALPLHERALKIREKVLGPNHYDVAFSLTNLANIYALQGDFAKAEPLYKRMLEIAEQTFGKNHLVVASSLYYLARFRLAQQRVDEAVPLFERALRISEDNLRRQAFTFSEARLSSFLEFLQDYTEIMYALVRERPDDEQARRLALTAALLLKGRSAHETANIYRSLNQTRPKELKRLHKLRSQQVLLALSLKSSPSFSEARRLKDLAKQADDLEADLARSSERVQDFYDQPAPDQLIERIANELREGEALVEFILYKDIPLVPESGKPLSTHGLPLSQKQEGLRYLAIVLWSNGQTHALDLGPAEDIDNSAMKLHNELTRSPSHNQKFEQSSAIKLYGQLFSKLMHLLRTTRRLIIVPDGQLSLVPFAALHDGKRFLLDVFDISYLTSGKELLPRSQKTVGTNEIIALGDIVYRSPGYSSLPGTLAEANNIKALFPEARLLLRENATKQALLALVSPWVLHIGAHARADPPPPTLGDAHALNSSDPAPAGSLTILADASLPTSRVTMTTPGPARSPFVPARDPLLRSYLLLAEESPSRGDSTQSAANSVVTALELAGMNLWGTQLVVLSACSTGQGDVKRGQGVYGLRRALILAGAETVVTSLWNVTDTTTSELMEAYYQNLRKGQGRTEALHEAMRELRQKYPHPHDWAPFIASGRGDPLRNLPSALSAR